jgi:putative sterol carrier protein
VPTFLSDAWVADLDAAARASETLRRASAAGRLTVQQVITGGPDGDAAYAIRLADGAVSVERGLVDDADVTFTQDHETAVGIGTGTLSAQAAFMAGRLRIGGDLTVLMDRQRDLSGLDDVFAAVRERTDYGAPAGSTPGDL